MMHMPEGPELWDDPEAGRLDVASPTLEWLLERFVKVMTRLGSTATVTLRDAENTETYVTVDFGPHPPRMRCNRRAIDRRLAEQRALEDAIESFLKE